MVSAEFEGTCTMMQSAAAGDPLSPESSYLRGMASAGYPHPEPGAGLAHPHHPHMQVTVTVPGTVATDCHQLGDSIINCSVVLGTNVIILDFTLFEIRG